MAASRRFDQRYCSRCAGLVRRHVLETEDGYMDVFVWSTLEAVEHVQATFMQDPDAVAYGKLLDPESFTMNNYTVLDSFEAV